MLPSPVVSLLLLLFWLALNQTLHVSHILLGLCLAIWIPWQVQGLIRERPSIKFCAAMLGLTWRVIYDIVMSALSVMGGILSGRELKSRFIWVPIELTDPHAISLLSGIITMTPGTLSADLSEDRRHLLIHAFDAADPEQVIAEIKTRYEDALKEIFQ
jgi:multicomponent K+:H+ antiporter subunit E